MDEKEKELGELKRIILTWNRNTMVPMELARELAEKIQELGYTKRKFDVEKLEEALLFRYKARLSKFHKHPNKLDEGWTNALRFVHKTIDKIKEIIR